MQSAVLYILKSWDKYHRAELLFGCQVSDGDGGYLGDDEASEELDSASLALSQDSDDPIIPETVVNTLVCVAIKDQVCFQKICPNMGNCCSTIESLRMLFVLVEDQDEPLPLEHQEESVDSDEVGLGLLEEFLADDDMSPNTSDDLEEGMDDLEAVSNLRRRSVCARMM